MRRLKPKISPFVDMNGEPIYLGNRLAFPGVGFVLFEVVLYYGHWSLKDNWGTYMDYRNSYKQLEKYANDMVIKDDSVRLVRA